MNLHFKYIHDLENEYFVTFFKHPDLFKEYYVKKEIFVQEHIGELMKIIEDLYQNKSSTTVSNIFIETEKKELGISHASLKMIVDKTRVINLDTIPSTIKTIKANKARVVLYELSKETLHLSQNVKTDISDLITQVSKQIDELQEGIGISGDDFDDILADIIGDTKSIVSGNKVMIYKTGYKEIDKKIPIVSNTIILVGGPAKAGKSRFVLWLVKSLMDNNTDLFAVKWYSFEEDSKELARKFIANDTLLRDSIITGKERKLTNDDLGKIIDSTNKFKNYNIKIEPNPRNIGQVKNEFQIFANKNSDKIPILIIDNALLLTDDDFKRDDIIMNTLNHIKQRTKAIIIIVHHFNDEQQGKNRENAGFRPLLKHLKGQESYRRVPKVVLLINYPYKNKELANKYKNEMDILKHMFIVDVAAIRDMPEIEIDSKSSDEPNLIHMYAELDFNMFVPLSQLY